MSDIFLSYKSEDKTKAQIIAEALEKKGYSVWWDRVIPPGRRFSKVIQEELDNAKCVVVLWSKESVKSGWVETEASEGDRRGILIPVLINDVLPPLAFRMIEAAKLIDWDGSLSDNEFELLSRSIARILGSAEPSKIEIHQPYEQENTGRKERGKERTGTEEKKRVHSTREEEGITKESTVKEGFQLSTQTNGISPKQLNLVSRSVVFWLGLVAYIIFTIFLINTKQGGELFLPNVFVIILANIFTLKKHKLAPRIFEVAVLVQIGIMILLMFLYTNEFVGVVGVNLAISYVLYYFSRVSRTLIKEQI